MAVESDSQQPRLRAKVIEMVKIAAASLEDLGATVTLNDVGIQQVLLLASIKRVMRTNRRNVCSCNGISVELSDLGYKKI